MIPILSGAHTSSEAANESASTSDPHLLEWMGRAFGDAVERAKYQALGLGGTHLEDLIQALPAAIYTTDADGRITFFNDAAAELWGCRPELGTSELCGSWKLYWPDGRSMPHGQCPMALALKERREVRGMEAVANGPTAPVSISLPIQRPYTMTRAS